MRNSSVKSKNLCLQTWTCQSHRDLEKAPSDWIAKLLPRCLLVSFPFLTQQITFLKQRDLKMLRRILCDQTGKRRICLNQRKICDAREEGRKIFTGECRRQQATSADWTQVLYACSSFSGLFRWNKVKTCVHHGEEENLHGTPKYVTFDCRALCDALFVHQHLAERSHLHIDFFCWISAIES